MLNRISIQTQPASITLKINNASLKTTSAKMNMQLDGNASQKIQVDSTPPKLNIDQSASLSTLDLDSNLDFMDRQYSECLRDGMDAIAKVVAEGVEFIKAARGDDPIVRQSKAILQHESRLSITALRQPSVSVQEGSLSITTENVPALKINWDRIPSSQDYQRGKVDISLRNRASIDISVVPGVELHFSPMTGSRMDAQA